MDTENFSSVNNTFRDGLQNIGAMVEKFTTEDWSTVQYLIIKQKTDYMECILPCICEISNTYVLDSTEETGKFSKEHLGYFKELSSCPIKFCCQCWRPWSMSYFSASGQLMPVANGDRPYKIPQLCCCPCSREVVTVQKDNKYIGKVESPYTFCSRVGCGIGPYEEYDIFDSADNMRYIISGPCCQPGVCARSCCLPRCCGPCQFIRFTILDANKQPVGEITNLYDNCCKEIYTKADQFLIRFPHGADYQDKLLITYAALMIDYDRFEATCFNLP